MRKMALSWILALYLVPAEVEAQSSVETQMAVQAIEAVRAVVDAPHQLSTELITRTGLRVHTVTEHPRDRLRELERATGLTPVTYSSVPKVCRTVERPSGSYEACRFRDIETVLAVGLPRVVGDTATVEVTTCHNPSRADLEGRTISNALLEVKLVRSSKGWVALPPRLVSSIG
jgi:hypothetical protein